MRLTSSWANTKIDTADIDASDDGLQIKIKLAKVHATRAAGTQISEERAEIKGWECRGIKLRIPGIEISSDDVSMLSIDSSMAKAEVNASSSTVMTLLRSKSSRLGLASSSATCARIKR